MSRWRVVITDSENETGVAPVCDQPHMAAWVCDCCPGPHIECGTPRAARRIAQALTAADAEVCS